MQVKILNKSLQASSFPLDYCKWLGDGCYNREFEQYDRHLTSEHTFVDVGAWVGAHSLYASTIAKQVVSVEPDPVAFVILAENNKGRIVHNAISDKAGVVKLGSGLLGASTTRINPIGGPVGPWEEGQTFDIPAITLRQLVSDLPDPLFIKIDVEGSEEVIFKDVELFRERKPTVMVEMHPWWWNDKEQTLHNFGVIKSFYQHPIEIFGNTWVLSD